MASPFDLCDDVIKLEILSRTSLETFNAMRCLNKEFDSLSYNPFLQSLRNEKPNQFSGFLMQKLDSNLQITHSYAPSRGTPTLSVEFLPADSNILCSSDNGLVVFEWIRPDTEELVQYHVAKPASRQMIAIPNPDIGFGTLKIAIVQLSTSPFRYKILRLSSCRDIKTRGGDIFSPFRLELFDSRTWVWKEFDRVLLDYGDFPVTKQPIVVSGSVYILFSNMTILSFDMYSETFSSIVPPLPFGVIPGNFPKATQLFKLNRSLGFARRTANNVWSLWVLQRGIRWTAICHMAEPPCPYPRSFEFDDPNAVLRINDIDYLFFKGDNVVDNVASTPYNLFVFKSDTEPIPLAAVNPHLDGLPDVNLNAYPPNVDG